MVCECGFLYAAILSCMPFKSTSLTDQHDLQLVFCVSSNPTQGHYLSQCHPRAGHAGPPEAWWLMGWTQAHEPSSCSP